MRWILVVMVIAGMSRLAVADVKEELKSINIKLQAAQADVDADQSAADARAQSDPKYLAAKKIEDDKEGARQAARDGGSAQDKLDAGAAYIVAKTAAEAIKRHIESSDPKLMASTKTRDKIIAEASQLEIQVADQERADSNRKKELQDAAEAKRQEIAMRDKRFCVGDVVVSMVRADMKKTSLKLGNEFKGESDNPHFQIELLLQNTSDKKKADYRSWNPLFSIGGDVAYLVDDVGNHYKRMDFSIYKAVGQVDTGASIYPGKELSELLIFEVPADSAKSLELNLPNGNLGGDGESVIKIQITKN